MKELERATEMMLDWCAELGIISPPALRIVPKLPGALGMAEYDGSKVPAWTVTLRRGLGAEMEAVIVHELIHVRTELTDPIHEGWIDDIAKALVAAKHSALAKRNEQKEEE